MRFFDRIDRERDRRAARSATSISGSISTDPGDDEVGALDDVFHFHPLALEDMLKHGQRPKLEDFGEYMFLVYYGAEEAERRARSSW